MSANNQTLIKKHGDKYYVFENINAEAWDEDGKMILSASGAKFSDTDREVAYKFAEALDDLDHTEYGVVEETLFKDDSEILIK